MFGIKIERTCTICNLKIGSLLDVFKHYTIWHPNYSPTSKDYKVELSWSRKKRKDLDELSRPNN